MKRFNEFLTVEAKSPFEKDKNYKKLNPKMKKAVDDTMEYWEKLGVDKLEKAASIVGKKHKVNAKDIIKFLEKAVLGEENESWSTVVPKLYDISRELETMSVEFQDGSSVNVDYETASRVVGVYEKLNKENKVRMAEMLEQGDKWFAQVIDYVNQVEKE